jgi:hypothetical protein
MFVKARTVQFELREQLLPATRAEWAHGPLLKKFMKSHLHQPLLDSLLEVIARDTALVVMMMAEMTTGVQMEAVEADEDLVVQVVREVQEVLEDLEVLAVLEEVVCLWFRHHLVRPTSLSCMLQRFFTLRTGVREPTRNERKWSPWHRKGEISICLKSRLTFLSFTLEITLMRPLNNWRSSRRA